MTLFGTTRLFIARLSDVNKEIKVNQIAQLSSLYVTLTFTKRRMPNLSRISRHS